MKFARKIAGAIALACIAMAPSAHAIEPTPGEAALVWRDYSTDGVPASGVWNPRKSDIRTWAGRVETSMQTLEAAFGAGVVDPTIALGLTYSMMSVTTFPSAYKQVVLAGYSTYGDAGAGCILKKGTGPNQVTSADGGVWSLATNGTVSAACYGAKADGTTDDTAKVNAAINDIYTVSAGAGGTVLLPTGIVVMEGVALKENVYLKGAVTTIKAKSATSNVLAVSDASVIRNVVIDGINFISASTAQTGGSYVNFHNCYGCRITNFVMHSPYYGVLVDGSNNTKIDIDNGTIYTPAYDGVTIAGGADHFIDHVAILGPSSGTQGHCGVAISQSGGTWISNSEIAFAGNGTCLIPGSGQSVFWTFLNNTVLGDSGSGTGLYIQASNGGAVNGTNVSSSWTSNNKTDGVSVSCSAGGTVSGLTLANHRAFNNGHDGIKITCGDSYTITGSTIAGNSNPSTTGTSNTSYGIELTGSPTHVNITNNRFSGSGITAYENSSVILPSGSDYVNVTGNDFTGGWLTHGLINNSTGTHNSTIPNIGNDNSGPMAPFTDYTATLGCSTGTLTSATVNSARWAQVDKKITVQIKATITTNGTCAGYLSISLPAASKADASAAALEWSGVAAVVGAIPSTLSTLRLYTPGGTYPGGNGKIFTVTASYEAQ